VKNVIQQYAIHPIRTVAFLAICASLLVAAVGYSVASVQPVRDPQNAAFVGNTIDTKTTGGAQIVRDPDNAAYVGNTLDTTTRSVPPVRDPAQSDQTAIRGATQGLR
jgi:hypothetical protein